MPGKRIGRGYGSGVGGHTVGRGTKGQKSRSGHKSTVFFEGGNRPLFSRLPKFPGFKPVNKIEWAAVNVSVLEDEFKAGDKVTIESLKEIGLVRKRVNNVKILGSGELKKKLNIIGLHLSETAKEKVLAAGGSVK
ncbi:50S ribosomal protein L15 [Candidatus Dojkabacteria bacterium]|nr:50S ribosomal protein L15 [Candidatus Dojkabacteria bacterium]